MVGGLKSAHSDKGHHVNSKKGNAYFEIFFCSVPTLSCSIVARQIPFQQVYLASPSRWLALFDSSFIRIPQSHTKQANKKVSSTTLMSL